MRNPATGERRTALRRLRCLKLLPYPFSLYQDAGRAAMSAQPNLVCPKGHLFFSPSSSAWAGRQCGYTRERQVRVDGFPKRRIERCGELLQLVGITTRR